MVTGEVPGLKGKFLQASLDEPVLVEVGDVVSVIGTQVVVIRNGTVVATRTVSGELQEVALGAKHQEVVDRVMFFRSNPVAGQVTTLTNVFKNPTTGALRFDFANGNQLEFTGDVQAMESTDYIDTIPQLVQDILIRKTLVNSPNRENLETCIGAQCSIDMNANVPVVLTIE